MVYPEAKNKTPVVLVISEIFGLTDWVRGVCDQLAENGVIAIAPDLLSGQKYDDSMARGKRSRRCRKSRCNADLECDRGLRAHENSRRQRHAGRLRILLGRGMGVRVTRT